jgi:3-deoxy-manno-octulosonate cytidylyltransferase (CMP-KDO synthetase)
MSVTVIIPARYASTRLPGKPLLSETGKPLILHVVEAVRGAQYVDRVVVATDDKRIAQVVWGAGYEAVMTRPDHPSGTDRIAEAAELLCLPDDDVIVNVQGDEPEIPDVLVSELVVTLGNSGYPMATLCSPLPTELASNPNKVKVVFNDAGRAMYFSRAPIPFDRDGAGQARHYLHLGIYAYKVWFVREFAALPPTPLEKTERLEQLRALEHDTAIAIQVVQYEGHGIDTPEDYRLFCQREGQRAGGSD